MAKTTAHKAGAVAQAPAVKRPRGHKRPIASPSAPEPNHLRQEITARQLAALPPAERSAILRRQAAAAAESYRTDAELTIVTTALAGDGFLDI